MKPLVAFALAMLWSTPATADKDASAQKAVETSQAAIGSMLPDLAFTRSDGARINLSAYRGRPLLVSLVYTGCADVCPALIENLAPAVDIAQDALGRDSFSVVTVGFDTRNDTPARLRSFARQHGATLPNWDFLAADAATLDALVAATGFSFYPSAGGFDHMAQVTVVGADGVIYQHVYGGVFEPRAIVEPLKDLVFGRSRPLLSAAGLLDRVRFYCTIYNPNTGRYYFNYSLIIGIAIGVICIFVVGGILIREFLRSRRLTIKGTATR